MSLLFTAALDFPKFVPKVDVLADCSTAKVHSGFQLRIEVGFRNHAQVKE